MKIEEVFEAPRLRLLGFAFGPVMVGEAGDSVTTQAKLALDSIPE